MADNLQNQKSLEEQLNSVFASTNYDKNYNASKALISSIPSIGSLLVNFMESYIIPPANKRLQAFLVSVVRELEELKSKNREVDFNSPVFVTTFLQAYQIAIRNHQEEKLKALRNAVLNSSIPNYLDDDLRSMFLNWIDDFTSTHILVLKCLDNLEQYKPDELKAQFPELENKEAMYNQILADLFALRLIDLREVFIGEEESENDYFNFPNVIPQIDHFYNRTKKGMKIKAVRRTENIKAILNNSAFRKSKTTKLGKQFIQFIENPSSLALS